MEPRRRHDGAGRRSAGDVGLPYAEPEASKLHCRPTMHILPWNRWVNLSKVVETHPRHVTGDGFDEIRQDRTCWDEIALSPLCRLLFRQFLLERDDFLQGVGVVPLLQLQLALEIGVALLEPRDIFPPTLHFQYRVV